jgi:hypothetical protein
VERIPILYNFKIWVILVRIDAIFWKVAAGIRLRPADKWMNSAALFF